MDIERKSFDIRSLKLENQWRVNISEGGFLRGEKIKRKFQKNFEARNRLKKF